MENLIDPEALITCPYDPAHRIRSKRMSGHLVKCKKNFPEQKMVTCDFNATHHVPEPELHWHHDNCEYRRAIEAQIVDPEEGQSLNRYPIPNLDFAAEEDWNNMTSASYNPIEYAENNPVLRKLDVESAAKRKNFRMNERQRLNQLEQNSDSVTSQRPTERGISLPDHRTVTTIRHQRTELRDQIKLGANKMFLQYDDGPGSSN